MEKVRLDISDPNLRADGSERLELSLLIGSGAFSFFIHDDRNRVRALKSWLIGDDEEGSLQGRRLSLSRIVATQPLLGGRFVRSTVGIANEWVSLVPDRVFDEKNLPAYFKLLMESGEGHNFFAEKLAGQPVRLVWAVEKDMVFFCQNNFPGSLMRHVASGLLESWRALASPHGPEVFANVRGKSLQMAVFDRAELLLFNTFPYQTSADFLYYVMLAFEQFRLDPENTPLLLCGELVPDSEIWRTLYRFIRDVRFLPRPARLVQPNELLELPGHLHVDLLSV